MHVLIIAVTGNEEIAEHAMIHAVTIGPTCTGYCAVSFLTKYHRESDGASAELVWRPRDASSSHVLASPNPGLETHYNIEIP
jgi:hypothetical protein